MLNFCCCSRWKKVFDISVAQWTVKASCKASRKRGASAKQQHDLCQKQINLWHSEQRSKNRKNERQIELINSPFRAQCENLPFRRHEMQMWNTSVVMRWWMKLLLKLFRHYNALDRRIGIKNPSNNRILAAKPSFLYFPSAPNAKTLMIEDYRIKVDIFRHCACFCNSGNG